MWSLITLPTVVPIGLFAVQAAEVVGGCVDTGTVIMLLLTTAGIVGGPSFAYGISRGKGKSEENSNRIEDMRTEFRREVDRLERNIEGLESSAMRVYRSKEDNR